MKFEDLVGRDVVIWGTGREGRAAHAELARRGVSAAFAVTGDSDVPEDLRPGAASGSAALQRLEGAEVVIKSPGVPRTAPELGRLRDRGVQITSLTDLWLSANADRALAVTGTKGKSTTASMAHHLLAGVDVSAALVGNGGLPVTDGDTTGARVAVVEVSSYQAADVTVSPRVAVVTSLYPEHLPWHGGYEEYVSDKLNLVAHGCEAVVVPDSEGFLAERVRARVVGSTRLLTPRELGIDVTDDGIEWAGVGRMAAVELPVQGRHSYMNLALALAAVVVTVGLGGERRAELLQAARSFTPLAHRLERVPSADGRSWVDDSLATAPEAVVAALETYPDVRVCLLLGGSDRGLSFEPLRDYLEDRDEKAPVSVIALGPAGARWVAEGGAAGVPARLASSFAEALRWAHEDPSGADVVLLSPGAPSFDEFKSFEERSAAFRAAACGETAETREG